MNKENKLPNEVIQSKGPLATKPIVSETGNALASKFASPRGVHNTNNNNNNQNKVLQKQGPHQPHQLHPQQQQQQHVHHEHHQQHVHHQQQPLHHAQQPHNNNFSHQQQQSLAIDLHANFRDFMEDLRLQFTRSIEEAQQLENAVLLPLLQEQNDLTNEWHQLQSDIAALTSLLEQNQHWVGERCGIIPSAGINSNIRMDQQQTQTHQPTPSRQQQQQQQQRGLGDWLSGGIGDYGANGGAGGFDFQQQQFDHHSASMMDGEKTDLPTAPSTNAVDLTTNDSQQLNQQQQQQQHQQQSQASIKNTATPTNSTTTVSNTKPGTDDQKKPATATTAGLSTTKKIDSKTSGK